ncbi:MAG: phenylacetate-CoA ligase [Cryptosporangiaceae bacterium]|nr:phenylacetate-CoA ligase [Cryptosporangiaceae bacterium]
MPYWNPKTETLSRDRLRALQLSKLRSVATWAQARSPFYRRSFAAAGFAPGQLRGWDDLRRIPLLTRDEWMASQAQHPPYGDLLAVDPARASRLHTTSGTTGADPLRALDTRSDWAWAAELWCYAIWGCGIRPGDIAYLAFGYGSFIGFWGLHYGFEKAGVLTIPGGAQNTEDRIRQLVAFGATVVASTPTYALRLAQEAARMGSDLRGSAVRTLILSGEPCPPQTRALIEDAWGARTYDTAGMTEIGTIFLFECADRPGGGHVIEDHLIEEVADPETGDPMGYGELGERIVTSFGRSAVPLLRYRTADLVRKVPAGTCSCGRTFDLYEGGVLGRTDDMKLVRGTNVYPRAVEGIVREFASVGEFQIRLFTTPDLRDEIAVRVEAPEDPDLLGDLRRRLAAAHEGLRFQIERVPGGSLPRFELKARRVVDARA